MSFPKEKLLYQIQEKKSHICLGLDPHLKIWPPFMQEQMRSMGLVSTIRKWAFSLIDLAAENFPACKFQSAFYEAMGYEGIKLLEELILRANKKKLITILDAKRGDIASTMQAYGVFAFDVLKADILTIQPYFGRDTLSPLLPWLRKGHGVYLVWLSSNPSCLALYQEKGFTQAACSLRQILNHYKTYIKSEGFENQCGLVAGLTSWTSLSSDLQAEVLQQPLLLPGWGAQGGQPNQTLLNCLDYRHPHLLPVSRALTGLGFSDFFEEMKALENFDDYLTFVMRKINELKLSI